MARWAVVLVTALGLVVASAAAAQEGERAAQAANRGDRSISLNAGGGVEVGYWIRMSDRTDLGLNLGFAVSRIGDDDREDESYAVSLAPALKMYAAPRGPLAPYTYLSVLGEYGRLTVEQSDQELRSTQYTVGGSGGIGLDWFPISSVSVGGHVGVQGGYLVASDELEGDFAPEPVDTDGFFVTSFSSGIRVHLYF